ncbi:DUF2269 family protein [Amycolatopsis cynarae]|uniref:DUF2269 family protein n=1 Tax=Amycolatopsis cynarae TaxID=2995223 RepID=A0ABY7BCC6_9PSEU|nr:DUF2269 family protein [Amycolatopsis sp. HUAS 11-8]WAL68551.1 DUF2269 family protein [Amycolatopsis sp. HUAS 11-8]
MTKALLAIHVLAAIITIGPMTVAASMFPAATRSALAAPRADRDLATLRVLHRICRVYAVIGIVVPVFGLATAGSLHVLGNAWLITSIVLTVLAAAVLVLVIQPQQDRILAGLGASSADAGSVGSVDSGLPARLAIYTGMFNLLWVAVTVLMIVRPGSTTGA